MDTWPDAQRIRSAGKQGCPEVVAALELIAKKAKVHTSGNRRFMAPQSARSGSSVLKLEEIFVQITTRESK